MSRDLDRFVQTISAECKRDQRKQLVERSGTRKLALAGDTVAKRIPLREQLFALLAQVERCDKQLVSLYQRGRKGRAKVVEAHRLEAGAKAQWVADLMAQGRIY